MHRIRPSEQRKGAPKRIQPASPHRRRILEEARRHFFASGFRNVTMDDLAAELGMSKKTFYAHFSSKSTLLEAVLQQKLEEIGADLDQATGEKSADFLTLLHQLLACLQRHMDEIRPPFIRDIQREAPEMFKLVETQRRKYIRQHFGKVLGEGRKAGLIRNDVSVEMIIEILLGGVQAIMNPQKIEEFGLTPKRCLLNVVRVILHGALTERGRAKV